METMQRPRWWITAMIALLLATPVSAQTKDEPDDFVRDVLKAFLTPNYNVFINTGMNTNGRFLLQGPIGPTGGERSLQGNNGFGAGIGVGMDYLLRAGVRLTYTYNTSDLVFRTNNGDGSTNLNADDLSRVHSNILAAELMRYMLPARTSTVTPYATVGLLGTWWVLDQQTDVIQPSGGSTQFRWGALVSFGVQFKLNDKFGARLEAASQSIHNPFTGEHSFTVANGPTIDEPTRVNQTDYRIVGVYHFGKKETPPATTAKK